ncbi:MAG TPA: NADH-ubiquinone oxidoreductase-F iron-sulfur binding region domain-containing protein [Euzebyales bacterium]|nr:NADH-ubiquinone oxidoreductase-F iron-sulfur binding region domain-containing protein [Euzebyales bacterium]
MHRVLPATPYDSLHDYIVDGGGDGLATALELMPDDVIDIVAASGLRGRGGAGFPTGTKWRSVADAASEAGECHIVCNAAEGEPATAKDRALLARNPYAVIEGLAIGMHAIGARGAYVGVKRRFTHEVERLISARDAAVDAEWPGAERIRIVTGPDEYLFGEESAMLEVIEGKLPLPRILPPYQTGLFATMAEPNPTAVNNVETLSHVARILRDGADWFREVGTTESPGTMVFTIVGDVARPGVYELPLGTPARELIVDVAGATDILAIYAGTSNTVVTPDVLDLPMDFDSFAEAGAGLGSAGFAVYDTSRDIVQVCAALARFLAIESCGQCLACKLGTAEISERLDALVRGDGTSTDIAEIRRRTDTVTDLNRCYLPVGAALLVRSTLDVFVDEFEAHVGRATDPAVAVPVPKISAIDTATGEVTFDPTYHRKRSDWSYEPAEPSPSDTA